MKDSGRSNDWYPTISKTYNSRQRANWYSEAAQAYDRHRPRYPQEICDRTIELSRLQDAAKVLEIGCGPGIATVEFARRGFFIVSLEPSAAAWELAKNNCQQYQNVKVINTTFEAYTLETTFDAVVAATSFHWLAPEIRYQKTAAALKDGGFLILLWNTPPQPNETVCQCMEAAYQSHAPELKIAEQIAIYRQNLERIGEAVINSGYFENLVADYVVCDVTYSVESYIGMLSTLSPYIMLQAERREALFAELKQVLTDNYGGNLALSYLSLFQVARKK